MERVRRSGSGSTSASSARSERPADPKHLNYRCIEVKGNAIIGYRSEKSGIKGKKEVRWYYAGAVSIAFVEVFDDGSFVVHISSEPRPAGKRFEDEMEAEKYIKLELVRKP